MRTCYLISVGTSILQKIDSLQSTTTDPAQREAFYGWAEQGRGDVALPEPVQLALEAMREMTPETFRTCSAEMQTLLSIRPEAPRDSPIYLFASDTPEGLLAARVVQLALREVRDYQEVEVCQPAGLKLDAQELSRRGIPELLRLVSEIRGRSKEDDLPCVICVSGGWKPLSMLMAFAGMFLNISVYYAHEGTDVLELPRIKWQYDSRVFDPLDIRLLNQLYRDSRLPGELWRRLAMRQGELQQVSFLTSKEPSDDAVLSDFGRMALAAYLGEKQDPMTGLFNKATFETLVARLLPAPEQDQRREERQSAPAYCLAFADMDNLKTFNSKHGHALTDQVIRQVAARLKETIEKQPGSLVARRSGDEFWLLFETPSWEQAESVLKEAGERVKRIAVSGVDSPISVTIAGVWTPAGAGADWKSCEKKLEELHKTLKESRASKGTVKVETVKSETHR